MERCLLLSAWPTLHEREVKEASEFVRSSSVSRRDSMALSLNHAGAFPSASHSGTHRGSFATMLATGSRAASPHPHDPCATPPPGIRCLDLPEHYHARDTRKNKSAVNDYDEDEDDGAYRSGSCSRCLSRASSFSLGAGGMTPLAWKMSSSMNGESPSCRATESPCSAFAQEHLVATAVMERRVNRMAGGISFQGMTPMDALLAGRLAPPDRREEQQELDEGGDARGVSPPFRERSMAPAELVAERTGRQQPR
ncbi:hypothetical protein TcYC6_0048120 [Trypanosoma cruzi]|nr:hypothetical protein TcYC6_0048120 [Trypanosoma cruzi]